MVSTPAICPFNLEQVNLLHFLEYSQEEIKHLEHLEHLENITNHKHLDKQARKLQATLEGCNPKL